MSATIAINDLKFVIFGAGHDYTLADSGDGDVQVFSHPFVPLNSLNYAGQWYFTVPDEYGDPIDAVKDDLAHCTFDPVLGASFDTVGSLEVKCTYHREYIHDEETIIVEKTVKQIIEVVDHGTVSSSEDYCDLYTDGYGFYRPKYYNTVEDDIIYLGEGSPSKISSIPWRAKGLGTAPDWFCNAGNLTDISELAYADVSTVTIINGLLTNSDDLDLTPISNWDVLSVADFEYLFYGSDVSDLTPLTNWDVSNGVNFAHIFHHCHNLVSLAGIGTWDTSSATSLHQAFDSCDALTDISALALWDVSHVTDFGLCFISCSSLSNLAGISGWDMSSAQSMEQMFYGAGVTSFASLQWVCQPTDIRGFARSTQIVTCEGLEGFDVSALTEPLTDVFRQCEKLKKAKGLETWDVSNVSDFSFMFYSCPWLNDISALASWDMSSGEDFEAMFGRGADLLSLTGITWDLTSAQTMTSMFSHSPLHYSSMIGRKVYADAFYYWDYDGNRYTYSQVTSAEDPMTDLYADATASQSWTVVGSGWGAFDSEWINQPTWN